MVRKTPNYQQYLDFTASIKSAKDDNEFIEKMAEELKKSDKYFYKLSSARSRKGICAKSVRLVPSNFPKRSCEYEFYEGMMIITNCLISFYGVYDKERKKYGGKCFKSSYMDTCAEKALLHVPFDGKFVPIETLENNFQNNFEFTVDETVETYTEADLSQGGQVVTKERFTNPTKWISYQLVNDNQVGGIIQTFHIDLLGADMNTYFKTSFFKSMYELLQTDANYSLFNMLKLPNKYLFSSADYLVLNPPNENILQKNKQVSTLTQFLFKCLVEYSTKWKLVIPLNNTMSFSYINTVTESSKLPLLQKSFSNISGNVSKPTVSTNTTKYPTSVITTVLSAPP
jgi:hypothetical protein